jgi:hypothetical protein
MNGFDEVVREGFELRLRAITEAGGVPRKRARSVLSAIRRRRAVRAGTATGVSVLAVGALAFGAINLGASEELTPGAYALPTTGAYPWCDVTSYPAVNPEALGEYSYAGRIYVNEEDGEYVYVAPDGLKTALEPDADGNYYATTATGGPFMAPRRSQVGGSWSHMAWDFGTDGSGGGRPYFVTPDEPAFSATVGPGLLYEWSTATSGDAPAGVDAAGILSLQLQALGFAAPYVATSMVPTGAALEQVLRWNDGRERTTPLNVPEVSSTAVEGEDLIGLASVSMRVTGLPGGATYEVISVYDPTKTWAYACGTDLDLGSPAPVEPPFNWGPYFLGPESTEFQCLAVVPREDEDVIPFAVETGVGAFSRSVHYGPVGVAGAAGDEPIEGDFGTGGILIDMTFDVFAGTAGIPDRGPLYPGWNNSGWETRDDGTTDGATTFGALAWIDAEGRIIGREVAAEDAGQTSSTAGTSADTDANLGIVGGRDRIIIVRKDLATAGVPCDGVDASALATASVVWIQGIGPDADHMTWSWTRVWPASQN